MGADLNIAIWNLDVAEEKMVEFTASVKTSKELLDLALASQTGELYILTNKSASPSLSLLRSTLELLPSPHVPSL